MKQKPKITYTAYGVNGKVFTKSARSPLTHAVVYVVVREQLTDEQGKKLAKPVNERSNFVTWHRSKKGADAANYRETKRLRVAMLWQKEHKEDNGVVAFGTRVRDLSDTTVKIERDLLRLALAVINLPASVTGEEVTAAAKGLEALYKKEGGVTGVDFWASDDLEKLRRGK